MQNDRADLDATAPAEEAAEAVTMSLKEFAQHLGRSPSHVTQLRQKGRLVLTKDGKRVRVEESKRLIDATGDPSKQHVADRHEAARRKRATADSMAESAPPSDGLEEEGADPADPSPEYQLWRARRERAAALREEIKLGEDARDYLKRADVEAAVADLVSAFRSAIEALDDRLAPLLASESDVHNIRAILTEERAHALKDLSSSLSALTKK